MSNRKIAPVNWSTMLRKACPCCHSRRVDGFFTIKNAPVYSVGTVKTKEAALAVPRKDIELGFCNDCGFVYNFLFDATPDYFTGGYEDQQGFSRTFMEYLKGLSEGLISKYGLRGKTIMEIGCGKGEFLRLLVELSGGRGFGIDPAYEEGRQNHPNLTFHKEFYSVKHGEIAADLICCRHTFEHIPKAEEFLRLVRTSIDDRPNTALFFEVPGIKRILKLQAFWDVYYEHCNYFSAGSLARVFQKTGFNIHDLKLVYGDQYIAIEAMPTRKGLREMYELNESIGELKALVGPFATEVGKRLEKWRRKLMELKVGGARTILWGGGSKAVGFLTNFSDVGLIEYVVDINPHIEGNFVPGIGAMYVQPTFLREYCPDAVIIMNSIYTKEIQGSLREMGLNPAVYPL